MVSIDPSKNAERNSIIKAIDIFFAISGLRLDSGRILILWIPLLGLSLYVSKLVIEAQLLFEYSIITWFMYYVGMTLLLGTGIKRWMIRTLGEQKAWSIFQLIMGVIFFNIGAGMTASAMYGEGVFALSPLITYALIIPLFIIGFGCKYWATWVISIDTYYYRDLFFEKPFQDWTEAGPYKYTQNPMYGVGYLHAYCLPILLGSKVGLIFAFVSHISIFGFYYIAEIPFIKKTYL